MWRQIFIFMIAFFMVLIAGCARRVVVAEVLQQPLGKKIYLKHNLWYQQAEKSGKPADISCLNIQQGTIIPFGTEVEPLKASDSELLFKTLDGKTFAIDYDSSLTLLPMEAYIKNLFTLEDRKKLCQGMNEVDVKMLERGDIRRGMTKSQILTAFGTPAACRTPSTLNNTWVYWTSENSVYRVVFRDDQVNAIVDISDKPKTLSRPEKVKSPQKSNNAKIEKAQEGQQ